MGVNNNDGPSLLFFFLVPSMKLTNVSQQTSNSGSMDRFDLRTSVRIDTQLFSDDDDGIVFVVKLIVCGYILIALSLSSSFTQHIQDTCHQK